MAAEGSVRELTVRAILLGGIITLVFTAANVYLGLKVGLTFATSIPAAVISMAILRWFSSSTILENNIVQTVASAAGTLAAIIFVLPGLVMIGWWQGFPFVTTAAITMLGGILGVLFSVPLRRAMVVDSPLPFPEGRAAAEVLQVGSQAGAGEEESSRGLSVLVWSSLVSAGFAILTQTRLVAAEASAWFRAGAGATGISGGLSFALMGVGHLVGISVGMAMFLGLAIGWWVLLPILTAQSPFPGGPEEWALTVFTRDVRFFGAGVIGVAAVSTLLKIAGPVLGGIRSAMAASA
jgi:putative OPT family oligopeptide transporter